MIIDKLRGFAFITFDDYDSVDQCILSKPHIINKKELDVRKAIPREQTSRNSQYNHQSMVFPTPYTYYYPTNYLSKSIPLLNRTNIQSSLSEISKNEQTSRIRYE